MSTISAIPLAEETDTLIQKTPQASLKFQAHMGAAMMHQGQPVSCLLKNVVVVEDREMEHRIPDGDINADFGKHGKHLCKGPSKDGNVCANAGTDREAYCTYSLGPALYPEEFPVDLHFCAYCADDN